jgi:excisionase family DNA binding protein
MAQSHQEIKPRAIYTLADACDALQVSSATLLRWIREGKVPDSRIGRGYRFTGQQLLDVLNPPAETTEPSPTPARRGRRRAA